MKQSVLREALLAGIFVFFLVAQHHAAAAEEAKQAPDFELADLQGRTHRLSDYRGKVVIINFWASWCPECIEEMPSLSRLFERQKDKGLVVFGISADRKNEPVIEALKRAGAAYPILLDKTGGVFVRRYVVIGLPTTVIIDQNGLIIERIVGATDFDSPAVTKRVQELLGPGRKK